MKNIVISVLALLFLTGLGDALPGEPVMEISATVSPSTIVVGAPLEWVTVHTNISLSRVATASLTLNSVPVAWTKSDNRGNLVAKFEFGRIEAIVKAPSATLTLEGESKLGVPFFGVDTVDVKRAAAGPK